MVEVSWDEALNAVAQGLNQHKGDQFAVVGSSVSTNEESYVLQKFARAVMQSNNVALAASFPECDDGQELVDTLRTINVPAIRDVRNMSCILAIGTNVFDSHPIIGLEIRHALSKGARLITVDPCETNMAKCSAMWLQPKVGTDHILLAGMINVLTKERQVPCSAEFAGLDLAKVEEMTGVKRDVIVAAAHMLAQHTPAIIVYGSGVTHHQTAPDVMKAIHSLTFVVGDVAIMGVPGEGNFVGAHDMGIHPAMLPGYCPVSSSKARAIFDAKWNASLSATPGRTCEDILDGVRQGKIKALYLAGELPPLKELANLTFLVVQDIVHTKNLQHAHVVLPATTFAEMDGTLTNLEGRVQRLRQAIPPVGLSRPGWMILRDIAKLMGAGQWNYNSTTDVMSEINSCVPAYQAINNEELDACGALRRFKFDASLKFAPFKLKMMPDFLSDEFPFTLITERNLFYYHGTCLTQQVKGMNLIKREEVLQLNPSDLTRLGITNGAKARISSRHGSAEYTVQANSGIPEGAAFTSISRVIGSSLFPMLAPNTKACAVRIERSRSQEV